MNTKEMLPRYRLLATALAVSLCLTSSIAFANRTGSALAQSSEKSQEEKEGEDASITEVYSEYAVGIQTDVMKPLAEVALQPPSKRTGEFVDKLNFDPIATNERLASLLSQIDHLEKLDNSSAEKDITIAKIKKAAEDIQKVFIQPLIPTDENHPPKYILKELNTQREKTSKEDRANLKFTEGEEVIIAIQKNTQLSVSSEWEGFYGPQNFASMYRFVSNQNSVIENGLDQLTQMGVIKNIEGGGSTDSQLSSLPLSLPLLTFLGGVLSTLVIVGLIYAIRSQSNKKGVKNAEGGTVEPLLDLKEPMSSQSAAAQLSAPEKNEQKQSNLDVATTQESKKPEEVISDSQSGHGQSIADDEGNAQQGDPNHLSLRSNNGSDVLLANNEDTTGFQTDADIYNRSPHRFEEIHNVDLSKESQREIWSGKNVKPILSKSPRGNYCVVTLDRKNFYIVVKKDAILNDSNLKTMKIIYDFLVQSNMSALNRYYKSLAKVETWAGTDDWVLLSQGELLFHP